MNRFEPAGEMLSSPSIESAVPPTLRARTLARIRFRGHEVTPHATFAPIHYEPGYAYPLIVWLHGPNGDERQLRRVMPLVSLRNYVAIAPRGTSADRAARNGFSWQQTTDDIDDAESRVFACVETAQRRFHIHPDRVFLAGIGCGGTMALRIGGNHPAAFAGVASFGGRMPTEHRPLRHVNALRQLPCLVATGRESRDYPEPDVCRDLCLLHAAGCTVALRQYPGGDELTTTMLADLDRWIMGIVCPSPA